MRRKVKHLLLAGPFHFLQSRGGFTVRRPGSSSNVARWRRGYPDAGALATGGHWVASVDVFDGTMRRRGGGSFPPMPSHRPTLYHNSATGSLGQAEKYSMGTRTTLSSAYRQRMTKFW